MVLDLSYLKDQPSEAQEAAIQNAVEVECLKAIGMYLVQIADTMKDKSIETLNEETVRAMAAEMEQRAATHGLQPPAETNE